jgi:PAS domain S-box-containing protein
MEINILLVDDRPENLLALEALIRRDDIRIFQTTSPNEALKLAWEKNISIAMVDVQMPGMDGFELVQLLKSNPRTKGILVIFVTAINKENKYAIKGYQGGAVDYLYKPLDPYVTAAKVDAFIRLAKAQKEIEKKNTELENYSLIVKNAADLIVELDTDNFKIKTINPAVRRIFGFEPEELIGKGFLSLCAETESESSRHLNSMVKLRDSFRNFEDRFVNAKREQIWLDCRVALKEDTMFLSMNDISLRKAYTDELLRSREMAEQARKFKENFLANMSHEIRTPINGIIALIQILKNSELDNDQRHILDLISMSSGSLVGVINDVLDLSKIEAGKFSIIRKEANIRMLMRSIFDLLKYQAEEKGILLRYSIDPDLPGLLIADSLRLNQILMNLASNAIKFTGRGEVSISVRVLEKKADQVCLSFSVEDTGIGIPVDKLGSIFDSFSQASESTQHQFGGTGLGLAIVKKLAELKGGELKVYSQPGKGSRFIFENWYTVVDDRQEDLPQVAKPEDLVAFFPEVNILLAEDNKVNQFAAVHILKKWNCRVDVAENGEEAIQKLKEKDYHLILMDTHMPLLNGYETAQKIRSDFKGKKAQIPIISMSAAVLENELSQARQSGMNDFVTKPFDLVFLYERIEKWRNGL